MVKNNNTLGFYSNSNCDISRCIIVISFFLIFNILTYVSYDRLIADRLGYI